MTTLISWIGIDQRGPASLYLASDSRISWGSQDHRWDVGRKLFTCRGSADIFGYCGDVLFPSLVLGQFTEAIDRNLVFAPNDNAESRHASLVSMLKLSFQNRHNAPDYDFEILHAARENEGMGAVFRIWRLTHRASSRPWTDDEIPLSHSHSGLVAVLGSGSSSVAEFDRKISQTPQGRTSRAVFWAFCDALKSKQDPLSGGAPQLSGLYRKGAAKVFGLLYSGQRYFQGLPLEHGMFDKIEWRDELFQRISAENLSVAERAKLHGRGQ